MLPRRLLRLAVFALVACGGAPPAPSAPATPASPAATGLPSASSPPLAPRLRFSVTLPASLAPPASAPLDGRLLLVLAPGDAEAPRKLVSDTNATAQVFGVDVHAVGPGLVATIDDSVLGYPVTSLSALPAGDYTVEAVVHPYEPFTRADGRTLLLPPDRGEGQDWTQAPGSLVSAPRRLHVDPAAGGDVALDLASALPELPPTPDTKYIKHIRIQSERLTKFWGRPMFLGAIVTVPEGWDTHADARYPLVIEHGHFAREPWGWRETPPDPSLPAVDLEAIRRHCPNGHEHQGEQCTKYGYERLTQQLEHAGFEGWRSKHFPRVLLVSIQHANPYYDDSYAVNSANLGPYGDAITYELVPYLEKTFRGLGPWARGMIGGSTGGWEALAAQVFYPGEYNGAIASCPDPVDFHAYEAVDVYEDRNAYFDEGPLRRTPRPASRDYLGRIHSTVEQENLRELVLGTHSRSGGQWDIWQAVFSPAGADGYPAPIWDKRTGVIDRSVAEYWRQHYDIEAVLARDWARLGPQLRGKITVNVGLSDNYFLNDAVYLLEDFLRTAQPPSDARFEYGARDEHCWSGDHANVNAVSRLTYAQRQVPRLVEHWLATAPKGADVRSWRY
ncbi:MAG TPA: alpha/beta hydrolase-fold protein [Polyangiaceae bacterium]